MEGYTPLSCSPFSYAFALSKTFHASQLLFPSIVTVDECSRGQIKISFCKDMAAPHVVVWHWWLASGASSDGALIDPVPWSWPLA